MNSAAYKRQLSGKKGALSDYKKRRSQLETIRSGFSAFDGPAADLNRYCSAVSSDIQSGITVSGGFNDAGAMWRERDSGTGDVNLSSSKNYINLEIQQVQEKIDELNRTIDNLSTTIAREEKKEKEEAKKKKT